MIFKKTLSCFFKTHFQNSEDFAVIFSEGCNPKLSKKYSLRKNAKRKQSQATARGAVAIAAGTGGPTKCQPSGDQRMVSMRTGEKNAEDIKPLGMEDRERLERFRVGRLSNRRFAQETGRNCELG